MPTFSASSQRRCPDQIVTRLVCPLMLRDLSVRGDGVMPNSFSSLRFLSGSDARNPTQIVYNSMTSCFAASFATLYCSTWYLVLGTWYCTWYLVLGMVFGTLYLVLGTWYGTWYLVWYLVLGVVLGTWSGTWYLVLGLVLGTCYLLLGTWCGTWYLAWYLVLGVVLGTWYGTWCGH